jgi:hypothetical protein
MTAERNPRKIGVSVHDLRVRLRVRAPEGGDAARRVTSPLTIFSRGGDGAFRL